MRKLAFVWLSFFVVAGLLCGRDAGAQAGPPSSGPWPPSDSAQNQADPPGRVARLNYFQGSVSFQPAGTQQWVDNLWAERNSRGELHVGSTAIRLSGQTGLSILNLNDQVVQIEVPQGSVDLHVRDIADTETYEVDTPNLAMTILRPGEYRIDVDPNGGESTITLRSGSAEITAAGKAYPVNPGQQYVFTGSDQLTYDVHAAPGRDDFENWSISRDQREDRSQSAKYVSREVIGYEDLDAYGVWRSDPEYGPVWVPNEVPVGWAPYHYGHWVYVAPWGWTWVEDEAWGFAPFHYGRWALVAGGWAWVPGPVVAVGVRVRPVYAPALVGFVGGGGLSVSFAIGGGAGVAWFPLGPRDVWVPAYRCSPRYVQNVNITNTRVVNVTQVNNVYVNRTTVVNNYTYAHNAVAVTAVSRETFVNSQPVARSSIRVNDEELNHPHVTEGTRLEPTQRSLFGPAASARALPPAALASRPVVTRIVPSANAVAVGHTQPLVNERFAYRPSTLPSNGQFNRPGGPVGRANGGFQTPPNTGGNPSVVNKENHTFQPPSHPGVNTNVTVGTNGSNPPPSNNGGNKEYRPLHPSVQTNGNSTTSGGNNTGNQPHANPQSRYPGGAVSGSSNAPSHQNSRGEKPKPENKQDEHGRDRN